MSTYNSKPITARVPLKIVERLEEMVKRGEARSTADAVNKVLDRYFYRQEQEAEGVA